MQIVEPYRPKHNVRIVTAASLFDGHDAAINIMRRIIQSTGCEVIHLGHDRSVQEVVEAAIQEDAQAIAMTSYQGGHMEYFKFMKDLLDQRGASHIKIFGGGGGVILPAEIEELHRYGIARIYSPDDGRALGLQGMINDVVEKSDYAVGASLNGAVDGALKRDFGSIARVISAAENYPDQVAQSLADVRARAQQSTTPVLGITGTGGAGKSSLVDELVRRFLIDFPDKTVGVLCVDPSKRKTGGALLGDRIRMNSIRNPRVYVRSLATRQANLALSAYVKDALDILKVSNFDLIILETSGIGQSDTEIVDHSDVSLYVMTPEYGAASQLEKIDMLDFADLIALNKFDKRGALDALRDVRKQYKRAHQKFDLDDDKTPVFGTIASQFNDPGTNNLYRALIDTLVHKCSLPAKAWKSSLEMTDEMSEKVYIIPPNRTRYLSEIAETCRGYDRWVQEQSDIAQKLYALHVSMDAVRASKAADKDRILKDLEATRRELARGLAVENIDLLDGWAAKCEKFAAPTYTYQVRGRDVSVETHTESLSHTMVPKIALPHYRAWGDILRWSLSENVPGEFPYAAGIYPFKREGEDPTRMFAGEGAPERTNRRFHYVSLHMPARRLSTAFDSVTLYGRDPDTRPDIYGKIGNSGVSVCCLDDAKKLYSGFNLVDPKTSVSMTINGPAPMILAYFLNAAIDQQCEVYIKQNGLEAQVEKKIAAIYKGREQLRPRYAGDLPEGNDGLGLMLLGVTGDQVLPREVYEKIKADTLRVVRGTVQADILKEDQAQNTCIFSTEFALRLMGDVQAHFIRNGVRNFYSVSISGYHIAEAGANPISQLAFTLANGFTYVEYY
ncbi:MAG TPA: methylmalonyl-CoA mutase family protein, partial [Candidatus Krumholzibacteria bacterium]|nr:methylmalonyl-CoA mutase family protein [Candidatus Krumholzibacteria bacterium]